mmetsp:Transcript_7389/g.16253  ORF Transcript_7389/g.16253 Transcript_7389/m.16253 type:complete len:361 (-) Transcript_7389:30-1112(-)
MYTMRRTWRGVRTPPRSSARSGGVIISRRRSYLCLSVSGMLSSQLHPCNCLRSRPKAPTQSASSLMALITMLSGVSPKTSTAERSAPSARSVLAPADAPAWLRAKAVQCRGVQRSSSRSLMSAPRVATRRRRASCCGSRWRRFAARWRACMRLRSAPFATWPFTSASQVDASFPCSAQRSKNLERGLSRATGGCFSGSLLISRLATSFLLLRTRRFGITYHLWLANRACRKPSRAHCSATLRNATSRAASHARSALSPSSSSSWRQRRCRPVPESRLGREERRVFSSSSSSSRRQGGRRAVPERALWRKKVWISRRLWRVEVRLSRGLWRVEIRVVSRGVLRRPLRGARAFPTVLQRRLL